MNSRFKGLVIGLILGFLTTFIAGMVMTRSLALEGTYTYLKLFNEVLSLVRNAYVDEVDTGSLMRGAYDGMLSELDPFSEYLAPDRYPEYVEHLERMSRKRADAGLRVAKRSGLLLVVSVIPGSDAEKSGITPGDRIRKINDKPTRLMNLFEAEALLGGKPGGSVSVDVTRREEPRNITTDLTFRETPLPGPGLRMVEGDKGLAVLTLPHFKAGTSDRVEGLLRDAPRGTERLLIDLRGNAWGTVEESVKTAGLFIDGKVVARVESRHDQSEELLADRKEPIYRGVIAVLVDRSTAEAAELFAAALRDEGAELIGEPTFGVGAQQELLPLRDGGYLKLSVRKYVSPSGTSWHGEGLEPTTTVVAVQENMTRAERLERQLDQAIEHLRTLEVSSRPSTGKGAGGSSSSS